MDIRDMLNRQFSVNPCGGSLSFKSPISSQNIFAVVEKVGTTTTTALTKLSAVAVPPKHRCQNIKQLFGQFSRLWQLSRIFPALNHRCFGNLFKHSVMKKSMERDSARHTNSIISATNHQEVFSHPMPRFLEFLELLKVLKISCSLPMAAFCMMKTWNLFQ